MTDSLRDLLYPLGFLSQLMFGGRFLIQWITSEIKKQSVVPKSFWSLSLTGNILLFIHAFIQLQFHVFVVQGCNAVISWRNLNLMQPQKNQVSLRTVIALLIGTIIGSTVLFYFQSNGEWFRIPNISWIEHPTSLNAFWHFIGFLGIVLFASRFWVQWWAAEIHKRSFLGKPFWWLSLIGDLLMLIYFTMTRDPVMVLGAFLGLIPYVRNLMLLKGESP